MKRNEADSIGLKKTNQELLDKVASLESRLNESEHKLLLANQQLEQFSAERSAFVSAISHDLKTPLTGIKLFADLAMSHESDVDDQDRNKYLSIISSETDRLSRLISNVVDYQAICCGNIRWHDEPVEVANIIEKCARTFAVLCESKGLRFNCDLELGNLVAVLDKDRLARLLFNLLSNALKFTRQGDVKLVAKMSAEGSDLCLSVSDTGQGVSEEQLQKIFEPSAVIPPLADGIGLFVSNYIVAHYKGRLWAKSVVGEGSVFYVELPLSKYKHANG